MLIWTVCGISGAAQTEEIYRESGAEDLADALPETVQDTLDELHITVSDAESLLSLSPEVLLTQIWTDISDKIASPVRLLASGVGLALLCALFAQFGSSVREGAYRGLFDAAAVVFAAALVLPAATSLFESGAQLMYQLSSFLFALVPVYGAVLVSSGQPVQAAISDGTLGVTAQVVSAVSGTVLVPLLSVYLAIGIAGALCPALRMDGIASAAKKIVIGALGVLMTVFTAILTLKGTLAQSSDSAFLRTVKFAAGTLFPVVGGAVSESIASVQGSMDLIRGSIGGFALAALLILLLPPVILLLLHQGALLLAAAAARFLQADALASLYKNAAEALSLLSSLIAVIGVMLFLTMGSLMRAAGG